jgi:hypothetical protein
MSIDSEMLERASKKISDEIDFRVLESMLITLGWTKVILSPMTTEKYNAIDDWVKFKCVKPVETMGLVWIFEDAREAVAFTLKWA